MAGKGLASINIRFAVNLAELSTGLQNAAREAEKAGKKMQQTGQNLSLYVTAPLLGLGGASIKAFGDLQALDKGLTSTMGSAEAAAIEFEKLREVAKLPGLGLEEAVRGSVNLQSAGFSADQARESLLAFGNALATVGKGKRELDLVILALTQLNNKSSGFGQDLRQLTEQLPQLRGALTSAFGTADSEEIAKLGVTGKQVVQLLTKEFSGLPKVAGGINNAFENASDSAKIALADLGKAINEAFNVEGLINTLSDALTEAVTAFKELSPAAQKTILGLAGVAAGIGPVLIGLGALSKVVTVAAAGMGVLSTATLFIPAAVAAIGLAYAAYDAWRGSVAKLTVEQKTAAAIQKTLTGINDTATKSIAAQRLELDQLVVKARNLKEPMSERKKAIEAINKISPEYLGNLTLETIRTDEATIAINKYNEALFKGALARAAQAKIDQNAERRINAQLEFEKKTFEYNQKKMAAQAKGWAELQKFFDAENASQALALYRYEDKLKLLDQEDAKLAEILNGNRQYLDLVKQIGGAEAASASAKESLKPGTIAYYEDQIKKLKELQEQFETTPEGVAVLQDSIDALQKKIDALNGVRIKVTSVFEGVEQSELQTQGSVEYFDNTIAKLREMQSQVATTSDAWYDLEYAIQSVELQKEITFDLPVDSLNAATEGVRVFGQNFREQVEQAKKLAKEFADQSAVIAQALEDVFASFADGMTNSLVQSEKASERFLGALIRNVVKVLAAMLSQSMASAVAGASSAAAQTGVAAPVTLPAFIAQMTAAVIGAFAAIPKFESGGIVGGSSYFGDRLLARVNSGEVILNQRQQRRVLDMINPAVSAEDVAIQLIGGWDVEGSKLKLVLDRTDKKIERGG